MDGFYFLIKNSFYYFLLSKAPVMPNITARPASAMKKLFVNVFRTKREWKNIQVADLICFDCLIYKFRCAGASSGIYVFSEFASGRIHLAEACQNLICAVIVITANIVLKLFD